MTLNTKDLSKEIDLIFDREAATQWVAAWNAGTPATTDSILATAVLEQRAADILAGKVFKEGSDTITITANLEDIYLCWVEHDDFNIDDYDIRDTLDSAGRFIEKINSALNL